MSSTKLFTHGPANVDSLLATTKSVIADSREYLNDAIFQSIPLLKWLNSKALVTKQGGASILAPLLYGKNSTFRAYSGDDVLDTSGQEGMTMAQYPWRNYGGTIVIFGDELRQNMGQGKLFDLLKAKTMQAMMSARDTLNIDLFASTQAAKKVSALPVLVDASSTVADVNSSSNSWWQAQVAASGSFPARGLADMRDLRDDIMRQGQQGVAGPDLWLTTQLIKELYEASQVSNIRYGPRDEADASFSGLKFSTGMVEFDPNCATGEMYALHLPSLEFVVHSEANWDVGDFKEPTDQDVRVAKVIWMGNLIAKNRRRLGKLTGMTA